MQLEFPNLEKYIRQHANSLVQTLKMEVKRNRDKRLPIDYTGRLAESFTLVEEKGSDGYVINITGLSRYKNLLPVGEGGTESVIANVDDIFDWMVRKLGRSELEAASVSQLVVDNLAARGYSNYSRVNFVSEAIEKKKDAFKPTNAVLRDIKSQILVILKEAGMKTEGKTITIK